MKNFELGTLCKETLDGYAKDFGLEEYQIGIAIHALIREEKDLFVEMLNMIKEIAEEDKEND